MSRMRIYLVAAIAAAVLPVAALAQQAKTQNADELVQRAQALQSDPAAYAAAASLYQASAALRSPGDARAVEALLMAGHLYNYAGEWPRALAAMEAGAARALKDGDPLTAANAYADAAYIAAERHDVRTVELAQKVMKIADHWIPEDRDEILSRLGRDVVNALTQQPNPAAVLALR